MVTRSMRWFGGWGDGHLSDESLLELHALLLGGEHGLAARYLRHVKACDDCAARLEAVRDDAASLRHDVTASADAGITPSRLHRQFDVIMRRIEGQPGRVLPFPATIHRPTAAPSLRRWAAVAAACGLLIGLGAGRLIGPAASGPLVRWQADRPETRTVVHPGATHQTDEQMLVDIDVALARSPTREFRALDQLTPRIADASARLPR